MAEGPPTRPVPIRVGGKKHERGRSFLSLRGAAPVVKGAQWMSRVSDVVFDVGRVLIDFSYDRFFEQLRGWGAQILDVADFSEKVDLVAYEHGEISSEQFLQRVNALLTEPQPEERLITAWNGLFSPVREMLQLAGTLKKHCGVYGVYLLSNTSDLHWEYLLVAYGLDKICHDRLASYEVGVTKPDPEIFAAACGRFDLQPEITVFIDDLEDNVNGAVKCGWQGVWHRNVAETTAQLSRLTGVALS